MVGFPACRRFGANLIISRVDRLSRDPVFLLSLRDAGIDFTAVDMPNTNRMTVGIYGVGRRTGTRSDLDQNESRVGRGSSVRQKTWQPTSGDGTFSRPGGG